MARTRKPAARHSRSVSRFTPRRWLPFLALTAVVAAGIVVASRDTKPSLPAGAAPAATAAIVPSVAEKGALSSAWFCGGGTAQGAKGPAEMGLVIANDAGRGATADVTVYDDQDGSATKQGIAIPADGRTRIDLAQIHGGRWVAATVEVRGGRAVVDREVRGPDGFDAAPCATRAANEWFVPSGSTLRGAQEYLSIFNPFPDASSVDISFATESGRRAPGSLQGFSIPGGSVRVVTVSDTVTARAQVAATVRTRTGRVVVDRVQTYDGTGDPVKGTGSGAVTTPAPHGLVSTAGFPGSAARWLFPGSAITAGNRSQVAIHNPSARAARVDLDLTYDSPSTNGDIEPIQLTVPARGSQLVDLTDSPDLQPNVAFSIDARSLDGVPIVAERLSFTGKPAKRRGAAVVPGSPVAARRWLVAQGGPSGSRSSSVSVANPSARAVHLRVVQLTGGTRRTLVSSLTVHAGDRASIPVADAATAATLEITADGPVVVAYGLSETDGLGLALANAEPFPESVLALPSAS